MDYISTRARRCINIQGELPESVKARVLDIARERGISRSEVVRELFDAARAAVEAGYLDYAPDRRGSTDDPLVHVNYTVWESHQHWLGRLADGEGVSGSAALRIALATGWRALAPIAA